MRPDVAAWLWLKLQALLIHLVPERFWRKLLGAVRDEHAKPAEPAPPSRRELESEYVPWDVAADTGEFTHIIKAGPNATLSVVLARKPPS
ncbi:MAG: hypothetical protein L0Z53_06855 [Acidobacteriales bacterium]|nr:hypothetical protein [Terriglobales bacterium]